MKVWVVYDEYPGCTILGVFSSAYLASAYMSYLRSTSNLDPNTVEQEVDAFAPGRDN